ncbi:hypothetical protein EUGRSUZ_G01097 [Eucalyptus grandis]|uniref:Uncharacterized protein n=2 Tax=Eucalyptus grandis TaxID=71139 RepID=A0ACC3K1M7_EUCGR|nr:hypothetical protein EUGRSUZ_G01097 [Eucalyptus grandis]
MNGRKLTPSPRLSGSESRTRAELLIGFYRAPVSRDLPAADSRGMVLRSSPGIPPAGSSESRRDRTRRSMPGPDSGSGGREGRASGPRGNGEGSELRRFASGFSLPRSSAIRARSLEIRERSSEGEREREREGGRGGEANVS